MAEVPPFKPFDPNTVPATADPPSRDATADPPSRDATADPPSRDATADKPAKRNRKPKPRARPRSPAAGGPKIPPAPKHKRPTRKKKKKTGAQITKGRTRVAKKITKKETEKLNKAFSTARSATTQALYGDTKKKPKTRELKLSFSAAMEISAGLRPNDFKIFEQITETLQSVNKATRRRVLGAISKVFG